MKGKKKEHKAGCGTPPGSHWMVKGRGNFKSISSVILGGG